MQAASEVEATARAPIEECGGSTERLLHELEQRARAEAAAVISAAERQAAEIRAAAASRCTEARAEAIRACDEEVAGGHAEALAAARLAARRLLLEAQHAAVARTLDELRRAATAGADSCPVSQAVLQARVADLLSYLGGDPAEIRCPPALAGRISALLHDGSLTVREDPGVVAGVRATTLDGRVTVDDTLDAWLLRERPVLAVEICRAIGGSHD